MGGAGKRDAPRPKDLLGRDIAKESLLPIGIDLDNKDSEASKDGKDEADDDELEAEHSASGCRVPLEKGEYEQDIGRRQQDACPEWHARKEEVERDGAAEEFSQVGSEVTWTTVSLLKIVFSSAPSCQDARNDGNLDQDVDRIEHAPAYEERVSLAIVQQQTGLARKVEAADDTEPRRLRLQQDGAYAR